MKWIFKYILLLIPFAANSQTIGVNTIQKVGAAEYLTLFIDSTVDKPGHLYAVSDNLNLTASGGAGYLGVPIRCIQVSGTPLPLFTRAYGGLHDAAAIDVNGYVWHIGDSVGNVSGIANGFNPLYATQITTDSAGNAFTGITQLAQFWTNNTSIGWYAIKGTDSTLWMWGLDAAQGFRLNNASNTNKVQKPVQISIPGNRKVIQVVAGYECIILCSDGTVWSGAGGGCNDYGNPLGNGCTGTSWTGLHQVTGVANAKWIAGGRSWNYVICGNDSVWAWGSKIRLGIGSTDGNPYSSPTYITAMQGLTYGLTKIVTNSNATYAIDSHGQAWSWGGSPQGETGTGVMLNRNRPVYPAGWGYDYVTDTVVISPTRIMADRSDVYNFYASSPYVYWGFAECTNGQLYFSGRGKGAIKGDGWLEPDSVSGNMGAQYDQSWNDSTWKPINPFTLRGSILVPAPPCVVSNAYPGCTGYTSPSNLPPNVNAGNDQSISVSTATLSGTATPQTGRWISSYIWKQTSGPTNALFSTLNDNAVTLSGLSTGTYVFSLTATDQLNSLASDSVTITVGDAPIYRWHKPANSRVIIQHR